MAVANTLRLRRSNSMDYKPYESSVKFMNLATEVILGGEEFKSSYHRSCNSTSSNEWFTELVFTTNLQVSTSMDPGEATQPFRRHKQEDRLQLVELLVHACDLSAQVLEHPYWRNAHVLQNFQHPCALGFFVCAVWTLFFSQPGPSIRPIKLT